MKWMVYQELNRIARKSIPAIISLTRFKVKQTGTFMYHSHVNVEKQEQLGLNGMLVSLPKKQTPKEHVDKDYTILLQEWQLGSYEEGQVPQGRSEERREGKE